MIFMRILPGVLKELTKHVPTVLFQTVEWSELIAELPKLTRRMIQKEGYDDLYQHQKILLDPYEIKLTHDHLSSPIQRLNKYTGEKWLTLYFSQIYSTEGIFLDLRNEHFEEKSNQLIWHPTGLWTKLSDEFREGLIKVYEGFYLQDEKSYFEGLEGIGLLRNDFSESDKKELGNIFKKQFGNALHEEMHFELDHLKGAIIEMSHFMLNKRIKISKDFLYLGIYLITMYSSLEKTQDKFPVKAIFLNVRGQFSAN